MKKQEEKYFFVLKKILRKQGGFTGSIFLLLIILRQAFLSFFRLLKFEFVIVFLLFGYLVYKLKLFYVKNILKPPNLEKKLQAKAPLVLLKTSISDNGVFILSFFHANPESFSSNEQKTAELGGMKF